MPAISLGFGEVEERLELIRQRLNSRTLQHVAYLSGAVIVALGALVVVLAMRVPPQVFQASLATYTALACAIGAMAALRVRSRWLSLEAVARLADREAALDSRLSTLCARRSRSQPSRLGGLLLAQTLALGPRWERAALVPRLVPRSVYLFLVSLALLLASWFVPPTQVEPSFAPTDSSPRTQEDEPASLEEEFRHVNTRATQKAANGAMGGTGERPGDGTEGGVPESTGGSSRGESQSPEPGELGTLVGGDLPGQELGDGEPAARRPNEGTEGTADSAKQSAPPNDMDLEGEGRSQHPSDQPDSLGKNSTAKAKEAQPESDSSQQGETKKPRSDGQMQTSTAKAGAKASGKVGGQVNDPLFEKGEPAATSRGEDGKPGTFALRLTGTSASSPVDLEPQNKKPREGIPATALGPTSPAEERFAKHQVDDDPLQKARISPEHETLLRQIFRHD